ncbi:MAG: hypothetical protein A2144_11720 [Chloroflexi bacterium RBG_16_50_9]|nr:MAG: hypothetical protein A2144_11720 [Chloroflexi bacterium RBG_16_50_9]
MDFQDCIRFANENRACFLATEEGKQPRVRPLGMAFADSTGFFFSTNSAKALYQQLKNNKKIEILFYPTSTEGKPIAKFMRVAGEIEFIEDEALKKKFMEAKPPRKKTGEKGPEVSQLPSPPEGLQSYFFRVYKGEAYFWTPEDNFRESEVERIKF